MKNFYYSRRRCEDGKFTTFRYYGGRGIRFMLTKDEVKLLWMRDNARLLKRPSLNRKDLDGDYTFDNCRFIEAAESSKYKRKSKKLGEKK